MCHPDQRAVTESGNNERLYKYTTLVYLEARDKACNLRLVVA